MRIIAVLTCLSALWTCCISGCATPPEPVQVTPAGRSPEDGVRGAIQQALQAGDGALALSLLDQPLPHSRRGSETAILWQLYRAEALALLERFDEAMEAVEQAARLAPTDAAPKLARGRLFWIDGKFDEAEAEFRAALEVEPDSPQALKNLGLVLIQSGKYPQAVVALEQALSFSPQDLQVLNNLGVAYASSGRLAEARELYERAVLLQPNDAVLRNNLADVLLRLGDPVAAAVQIDELVRLSPDRANAARLQRDLVTVSVVVDAACRKSRSVITRVEEAFALRGWPKDEAADSLRRVTGDPLFDWMVRDAIRNCPAP